MTIADDAEKALTMHSAELTAPQPAECLYHYLGRMLQEFGCRGHRFTITWAQAPRTIRGRPVLEFVQAHGGCCCDCEVLMNTFRRPASRRKDLVCPAGLAELDEI
jgi:hypothetical protein